MAREVIERKQKVLVERDTSHAPGRYIATITVHDQHYKDETDTWQPIDETIVDDASTPGYIAKCDKIRHAVKFGSAAERRWYPNRNVSTEYVDSGKPDYWDPKGQGSWKPWNLTGLTRGTNIITWETVDYRVKLIVLWNRIKIEWILKTVDCPTQIRFPLSFIGLTYNDTTGELTSNSTSTVVGIIAKPTAVDMSAAPSYVPVTGVYSAGYMVWTVDASSAIYPITVDPTFNTPQDNTVAATKLIVPDGGEGNWGASDSLAIGYPSSDNWRKGNSLIKYDLSDLVGDTINTADQYFYSDSDAWQEWGTIATHRILAANSDWVEGTSSDGTNENGSASWVYKIYNTTNWAGSQGCNTSGTDYSATLMGSLNIGNADMNIGDERVVSIDTAELTTMVGANYGFVWVNTVESSPWLPCSDDHATAAYRPKLVVDYTAASSPNFTRQDIRNLPANDTDLSTIYSGAEVTSMNSDDDTDRVGISASILNHHMVHMYKVNAGANTAGEFVWNGQTDFSPVTSTVHLQIYNRTGTTWDDIDTYSIATINTDFTMRGRITNLTNYKDGSNIVAIRVYQKVV